MKRDALCRYLHYAIDSIRFLFHVGERGNPLHLISNNFWDKAQVSTMYCRYLCCSSFSSMRQKYETKLPSVEKTIATMKHVFGCFMAWLYLEMNQFLHVLTMIIRTRESSFFSLKPFLFVVQ